MKKPETIADLNINLEFTKTEYFPTYSEFENYIKDKNPGIECYNIVPGIYSFTVTIPTDLVKEGMLGFNYFPKWETIFFDTIFFDITIDHGTNKSIINLLYKINYHIHEKIKKGTEKYRTWTELEKFKLIAKNSFEIEFTIPF